MIYKNNNLCNHEEIRMSLTDNDIVFVQDIILYSYLVNSPESTLSKLICFRKVVCRNTNSAKVELQGFHAWNFIINVFTRGTSQYLH